MLKRIWQNLRIVDQIQKTKRALASRYPLPIKHRDNFWKALTYKAIGCARYSVSKIIKDGIELKVFISWSGDRSKEMAKALRDWLPMALNYVEPFVSDKRHSGR